MTDFESGTYVALKLNVFFERRWPYYDLPPSKRLPAGSVVQIGNYYDGIYWVNTPGGLYTARLGGYSLRKLTPLEQLAACDSGSI